MAPRRSQAVRAMPAEAARAALMACHGTPSQQPACLAAASPSCAAPGLPVLWWGREFPGAGEQVAGVRHWVEDLLPACDPLEPAVLLASELCTNALQHTFSGKPGGRFTVDVEWTLGKIRVVIGDQGPVATGDQGPDKFPVDGVQAGDAAAENGRGLLLVDSLADEWGTVRLRGGRLVWFDIQWSAAGGPPLDPPGGWRTAAEDIAELRDAFPRTTIWWGHMTDAWHAALPGAIGADGVVSAPTWGALGRVLAGAYPRPGGTLTSAGPPRLAAVPAQPAPADASSSA